LPILRYKLTGFGLLASPTWNPRALVPLWRNSIAAHRYL